ncbi:hypothetical protein YB2330_005107 [Saitoella coloradoensis]
MVVLQNSESTFSAPWQTVTAAWFLRYPNPFSTHVLTCDTISSTLNSNGTLYTERLISKRGGRLPAWTPDYIRRRVNSSWILEECMVDREQKVMWTRSRNIEHKRFCNVVEAQEWSASGAEATVSRMNAKFVSNFAGRWGGLAGRIEDFLSKGFVKQIKGSREGLIYVLDAMKEGRMAIGNAKLAAA